MRSVRHIIAGDSPGTSRTLDARVWGKSDARPKVYIQAGLHADEMPGVLVADHLTEMLDAAEAQRQIAGEIWLVPAANPIGLDQWIAYKPQGRQDIAALQNFNRGFPDLAALAGDALEAVLTESETENLTLIRRAFGEALAALPRGNAVADLQLALMTWSHDADYVLDLHCDHQAIMHFYASPARPKDTALLSRATGAKLVLEQEVSGGNAFDEAQTAPWGCLRRRFGQSFPIPAGCFSSTLEYRGQNDVNDVLATEDAAGLMMFLGAIGAATGQSQPAFEEAPVLPLGGALEMFAPQGGVVLWRAAPGDWVTKGDILGEVLDPVTRIRAPVQAVTTGLLFRIELWPSCLRGQSLCHIAGKEILRDGHLLSDQ